MPDQTDYGTQDSPDTLVPDSLRAYRHFLAYDGQLWPCNGPTFEEPRRNPYYRPPGYVEFPLDHAGIYFDIDHPYSWQGRTSRPMVFKSECKKARGYDPVINSFQAFVTNEFSYPLHPAPEAGCSCGFYAHYSPAEDFYPSAKWGWDDYGYTTFHAPDFYGKTTMVKAVVEMSGKVVMGTRGVRAEKMDICALALDWSKYRALNVEEEFYWSLPQARPRSNHPSSGVREHMEVLTRKIAANYGAVFFEYSQDMDESYPQPDVSHLMPKQEGDEEAA